MSAFRQLVQSRMSPVLDSHFGEQVLVRGVIKRPNFRGAPDPQRPPVEAVAIFQWRSAMTGRRTPDNRDGAGGAFQRHGSDSPLDVATRIPTFSFAHPAPKLLEGDWIRRCESGDVFEVTAVLPDGVARTLVTCVQLGLSNPGDFS